MTDRPEIKPLEWEEIHYNRSNEEPIPELTGWYAETEVGSYYVMLEGRIEVTLDGIQFHKVGSFDEPEAAFEAAQSDFASRIRSCLLDKPEAVEGEPVAWIFEDDLPESYPYDIMFKFSKVDGVRLFPVYAPSPADTDAAQSTPEAIVRSAASAVIDELAERFAEKPGTADDYADYMRRIPEAIISALKGDRA